MARRIWIVGGLLVVAVLGWTLVARTATADTAYRFVEVAQGDVESTVSATGTLQATETVEVGTQVSGQIAEIYVDFNERVEAGRLLATIDPTLLEQAVRSAEVGLARSKADLDQAGREADRMRALHEQQAITDRELDAQLYQLAVAEANYRDAEIGLERAERNLDYSEIRAPIDGVVIARNVEVGQTVAASLSAPVLFILAQDLSQMEILAAIDESDIGQIAEGQDVHFSVQAYSNRSFEGLVRQVRLEASTQDNVVTYGVVVAVDNEDGALLPGMTATIAVVVDKVENALHVPNTALRFRPTDEMVLELQAAGPLEAREGEGEAASPGADAPRGSRPAGAGRDAQNTATLWYVSDDGALRTARVRTGLSDGVNTAVTSPSEDVQAGLQVIAAVTTAAAAEAVENPFQAQQQDGPPGRGGVR